MKRDGYADSVSVCNTEYEVEVLQGIGTWLWTLYATDYDFDGEEMSCSAIDNGGCSTETEAQADANNAMLRARSDVKP